MKPYSWITVVAAVVAAASLSIAQGGPQIEVSATEAAELAWRSGVGTNYTIQYTDELPADAWTTLHPFVIGDGGTRRAPVSTRGSGARFFRLLAVTNRLCTQDHCVLNPLGWSGSAFADRYYFLPDGTVTGSVYQWKTWGQWLPLDATNIVFCIYNATNAGPAHQGVSPTPLPNPIRGACLGNELLTVPAHNEWTNALIRR